MSSSTPATSDSLSRPSKYEGKTRGPSKLRIYSHSALLYWWPVWVVGYVMAFLSRFQGKEIEVGASKVFIHESGNLGSLLCLDSIEQAIGKSNRDSLPAHRCSDLARRATTRKAWRLRNTKTIFSAIGFLVLDPATCKS